MRILTATALVALALPVAQALIIAPGSPCGPVCGNVLDNTSTKDIVCKQDEYDVTDQGQMYEECLSCLEHSVYADDDNVTDTQWMLYNLRYALSYCVFGYPKNNVVSTPCMTSEGCGHYADAITYKNLSTDIAAYEYCNAWPGDTTYKVGICQECLDADGNPFMANYIIALQAGCEQKPSPGLMIGLDGDIFGTKMVNTTAASPTASVDPAWFDNGPLTLPVKVAIGAAGVAVLLFLAGACIIWNGRRRRRAFLRKIESRNSKMAGWASPQQGQHATMQQMRSYPFPQQHTGPETHDTPLSQRPLVRAGWDDSPMTAATEEKPYQRYFSPYSSQYNSPVSAHDTPAPQWQTQQLHSQQQQQQPGMPQNIGVALGGDDSSGRWSPPSPEEHDTPESYEMHRVDSAAYQQQQQQQQHHYPPPPVLSHPGYGRAGEGASRQHGLNEDDLASGRAF